jgi:hypothetical protein
MSVLVDEEIKNLRIIEPISCEIFKPCVFDSAWDSGIPLVFNWVIGSSGNITTNTSYVSLNFNSSLSFLITLTVANKINKKSVAYAFFSASEKLSGLSLYSGMSSESASITGADAFFKFMLNSGNNYECVIDFGDFSPSLSFTDDPYNYNNTFLTHVYEKTGVYGVTITCNNLISSVSKSVRHFVQDELSGLELVDYGVSTVTQSFQVGLD